MEESDDEARVVPELYFLIAKFLCGGPLKETAKTMLKELETVEVLPRRVDWEGQTHARSYEELAAQYADMPSDRLVAVCARALRLAAAAAAPAATSSETPTTANGVPITAANGSVGTTATAEPANTTACKVGSAATSASSSNVGSTGATVTNGGAAQPLPNVGTAAASVGSARVVARLSLLSDSLVRPTPKYSVYKQDHTLVRRLIARELGGGWAGARPDDITSGGGPASRRPFSPRLLASLRLQRRTLGHLSAVYCLAFHCTGRYVVTGADDLLVKVWSAVDGRLLATLRGAGAEITDLCVSSDGALLACGSVERLVRVWGLPDGAPRAVLHAHQGTITSVHFSPGPAADGRWLASTSTDGSVAFWRLARDGQPAQPAVQFVERARPGACHMICAAWSPGGAFLAAGSADQRVRVYHLSEQQPRRVLEVAAHTEAVDSVAWAHRSLRFVSGSKDGHAALWGLHATQWRHAPLRTQQAHAHAHPSQHSDKRLKVTMVCWDSSDAFVFTAVSDATIRVWCSRQCVQVSVLRGHRDEAYVLEPHPFLAGVALSAGHDGRLCVWHAAAREPLWQFDNEVAGQGACALFDAKWASGGAALAASDSHGHLVLVGLGAGHPLLRDLPEELFFHTDYRPLVRDALGGALDEQTETPPHLLPPALLVDVEGSAHAARHQRVHLAQYSHPAHLAGDEMGAGVRRLLPPLSPARLRHIEQTAEEMAEWEQSYYRREMRRRPLMINTEPAPRRVPGRRAGHSPGRPLQPLPPPPRRRRASPAHAPAPAPAPSSERSGSDLSGLSDLSDDSERLSLSDLTVSYSDSKTENSSDSSLYSDWEAGAGAALSPPLRARRRPAARKVAEEEPTEPEEAAEGAEPKKAGVPRPVAELPEAYRPSEWLSAVAPRKAPYHPQMGDLCLYFRLGHQKYFEAVAEKDVYKLSARDMPWERAHVYECEIVKVVGIKYVIKPPRVVSLRLACSLPPPVPAVPTAGVGAGAGSTGGSRRASRSLTVRYHDMADVIDFLLLKQQYDVAMRRRWGAGDRFRCMIDDSWWTGCVVERDTPHPDAAECDPAGGGGGGGGGDPAAWAARAAAQFLCLRVRWDNGELERLSPWDLEPLDPARLPSEAGGAVPVLPAELEATLYQAEPCEWPPRGDRPAACAAIAAHLAQVMQLSVAEPFVAPVDLQLYPAYATLVPYPIDLATIRARFENLFYRRAAAAQFDVRYLATNAELFNEPHSIIVRQARLVTDLLLHIISNWRDVNVMAKYRELTASYHSSDDEPLARTATKRKARVDWRGECARVLAALLASADSEPFRRPVSPRALPDYHAVVLHPIDLGSIRARLAAGEYTRAAQLAADVRRVFRNSRVYNTNTRSRIYAMTVRLSRLFEALWARARLSPSAARASGRARPPPPPRPRPRPRRVRRPPRAYRDFDRGDSEEPSTSRVTPAGDEFAENGVSQSDSGSESSDDIALVDVARARTASPPSDPSPPPTPPTPPRQSVRRARSSSGSSEPRRPRRKRKRKRPRRASMTSWSQSHSPSEREQEVELERLELALDDHTSRSLRSPSSDEDQPLLVLRQRQEAEAETSNHSRARSGRVSLRARSPRRYNEDSDEDSPAAISKRLQHLQHSQRQRRRLQAHVAWQNAAAAAAAAGDHDYFNGTARAHNGHAGAREEESAAVPGAVSVSSRGRLRRLTAKARHLLHRTR